MKIRQTFILAMILISAILSPLLACSFAAASVLTLTTSTNYGTTFPPFGQYQMGTQITITATPPDTDEYGRYVWLGWKGTGAGSYSGMNNPATLIVNDSINETASWRHEYKFTLNRAIWNKVTETMGNFTFAGEYWYEDGSQVSIQAPPPPPTANGERYVFDWWVPEYGVGAYQGPNSTFLITIRSPMNETARWAHQYQVEVGSSGVDDWHQEDTVTLDGVPRWNATTTLWPYEGEPLSFAFAPKLTGYAGTLTYRYVWVSTSGLSTQLNGTLIISAPGALTAKYKTQYYLDIVSPYETSGGAGWYDSGATTYATLPQPIVNASPGVKRVFTGWSGDGSGSKFAQSDPILMDRSRAVTADFTTQFQVAVGQSGVGSDFVGTVVTVDGVAYENGASFWWDNATSHTFSFPSQLAVSSDKMYVWSSTTGLSAQQTDTLTTSAPGLITGNYKTQYYLDVVAPGGAAGGGAGWYDSGATAYASLPQSIVNGSSGVRYVFTGWSGDASGTALTSNPITLDGSKSATALYKKQFLVVFNQTGLPNGFNVLVNSNNHPLPYSEWVDQRTSVQFAYQDQLSNGFGQQYGLTSTSIPSPLTVESPITVTAYYTTQYTIELYALIIVPIILILVIAMILLRRRRKT
jgi:hypothetical protein